MKALKLNPKRGLGLCKAYKALEPKSGVDFEESRVQGLRSPQV